MLVVIDYQMGNLRSVQKGFAHVGYEATISGDPAQVAEATRGLLFSLPPRKSPPKTVPPLRRRALQ